MGFVPDTEQEQSGFVPDAVSPAQPEQSLPSRISGSLLGPFVRPPMAFAGQVGQMLGLKPPQSSVAIPPWAGGSVAISNPLQSMSGLNQFVGRGIQTGLMLAPETSYGRSLIETAGPIKSGAALGGGFAGGQAIEESQDVVPAVESVMLGALGGGAIGTLGKLASSPEARKAVTDFIHPEKPLEVLEKQRGAIERSAETTGKGFARSVEGLKGAKAASEKLEQEALDIQKLRRKELEQGIGAKTTESQRLLERFNVFKANTKNQISQLSGQLTSNISTAEAELNKKIAESAGGVQSSVAKGLKQANQLFGQALKAGEDQVAASGEPITGEEVHQTIIQPLIDRMEKEQVLPSGKPAALFRRLQDRLVPKAEEESAEQVGFAAQPKASKEPVTLTVAQLKSINSEIRQTISQAAQESTRPYNFNEYWSDQAGQLYMKMLGNRVPALAEFYPQYAEFRSALKPWIQRVKPWNQYDTAGAEKLLRSLALNEPMDEGSKTALQKLQHGYGDIPGIGDLSKSVKPFGENLTQQKQIKTDTIKKLNQSINDQFLQTQRERNVIQEQIRQMRVERQGVGAPEAETTQAISKERVRQPQIQKAISTVKLSQKEYDAMIQKRLGRLDDAERRLERLKSARNMTLKTLLGLVGVGLAARGVSIFEKVTP